MTDRFARPPAAFLTARDVASSARPADPEPEPDPDPGPGGLVGRSVAMRSLFVQIERVARFDLPVLVQGETGSGKERVARAVHERSDRRSGPFVAVNCGAMSRGTALSALFGHERGAFTGASGRRRGAFRAADRGTLLLDEVAELPLELQASLLRVLEVRGVRPVGADREEAVDTRVLCATHKVLEEEVRAGRFREDLFYRLAVARVRVPPLRERPEDIPSLARHFLADLRGPRRLTLDPEALRLLSEHRWPGNVRELRNALLRAAMRAEGGRIRPRDLDLPGQLTLFAPPATVPRQESLPIALESLEQRERRRVLAALDRSGGNRKAAALDLGIARSTLYARLHRLGLRRSEERGSKGSAK